jgi:hypothetical protein
MKKTFLKKEENKYLQEIYLFNNYPNIFLPISKHYEDTTGYIIEYNDFQNLSEQFNKPQIDKLVTFIQFLIQENISLDYFSLQTIYIHEDNILFTINNSNIENFEINKSFFLDYELNQVDYNLKNNIYMLGLTLYHNYYKKLPNFNKLSKNYKKPFLKYNNNSYYSSYVNRIIESCINQNIESKILLNLILKDDIHNNITHRLYFIDEVCNSLYFSIYEGNNKDAIYWGSELFGVGEYYLIIKTLVKILVEHIGILYCNIFDMFYQKLYNFNKNHNRKKKEILIYLILLCCECKKNSIVSNVSHLVFKNLINDDLKLRININYAFNLFELDLIKMVKILIYQKKEDLIWSWLFKNKYHNFKEIKFLKKFNSKAIYLAVLDFNRNKYQIEKPPEIKINNNTLKYFGFNIKRNKNDIPKYYLNFDTNRGKPEFIRKHEYYGFDRIEEFEKYNIINNFTEEQKILYYGYNVFKMKQIDEIIKYKTLHELKIDNDYFEELNTYLSEIEENSNYIYTLYDYLNSKVLISNDCKTDQYNLVLLDTE